MSSTDIGPQDKKGTSKLAKRGMEGRLFLEGVKLAQAQQKANSDERLAEDKRLQNVIERGKATANLEENIAKVEAQRAKARQENAKATIAEAQQQQIAPQDNPNDQELIGPPRAPELQGLPISGQNPLTDAISMALRKPGDSRVGQIQRDLSSLIQQEVDRPVAQDPRFQEARASLEANLFKEFDRLNERSSFLDARKERLLGILEREKSAGRSTRNLFSQLERVDKAKTRGVLIQRQLLGEISSLSQDPRRDRKIARLQKSLELLSATRKEERVQSGEVRDRIGFIANLDEAQKESKRADVRSKLAERKQALDESKEVGRRLELEAKRQGESAKEQKLINESASALAINRRRLIGDLARDDNTPAPVRRFIQGDKQSPPSQRNFYQDVLQATKNTAQPDQPESPISSKADNLIKEYLTTTDGGESVEQETFFGFPIAFGRSRLTSKGTLEGIKRERDLVEKRSREFDDSLAIIERTTAQTFLPIEIGEPSTQRDDRSTNIKHRVEQIAHKNHERMKKAKNKVKAKILRELDKAEARARKRAKKSRSASTPFRDTIK